MECTIDWYPQSHPCGLWVGENYKRNVSVLCEHPCSLVAVAAGRCNDVYRPAAAVPPAGDDACMCVCLCRRQALSFIDALASGAVNLGVPWHEALQMAAKTVSEPSTRPVTIRSVSVQRYVRHWPAWRVTRSQSTGPSKAPAVQATVCFIQNRSDFE